MSCPIVFATRAADRPAGDLSHPPRRPAAGRWSLGSPGRLTSGLRAVALVGLVLACGGDADATGDAQFLPWTIASGGDFDRLVAGDLGLPSRSLAVVRSGVAAIAPFAGTSNALWQIDSGAVDASFVASPTPGFAGPDALVVAHSAALTLFRYQQVPAGEDPDPPGPIYPMVADPIATTLTGITRVRGADLDGDGLGDLIVIVNDLNVHLMHQDSPGVFTPYASFPTFDGHVIRDVAVGVFTGQPLPGSSEVIPEILLCTTDGLEVHNQLGARVFNVRTNHTNNFFAIVRQTGVALDRVALVHRNLPGTQWRLTMWGMEEEEGWVVLGPTANMAWPGMLAVTSGDRDGDGDDDVAIFDTAGEPRILVNQRIHPTLDPLPDPVPTFAIGELDHPWNGLGPADLQPAVLLEDLDRDGAADLFAAAINPAGITRHVGGLLDPESPLPSGLAAQDFFVGFHGHYESNDDPWSTGFHSISVAIGRTAFDSSPGMNALDVVVWRQGNWSPTDPGYLDAATEAHYLFVNIPNPLPGTGSYHVISFVLPRNALGSDSSDIYYVEVALAQVVHQTPGGSYDVVSRRRPFIGGFTLAQSANGEDPPPIAEYLLGQQDGWSVTSSIEFGGPGAYVGTFVGLPLILPELPPLTPAILRPAVPVENAQAGGVPGSAPNG